MFPFFLKEFTFSNINSLRVFEYFKSSFLLQGKTKIKGIVKYIKIPKVSWNKGNEREISQKNGIEYPGFPKFLKRK